MSKPIPTIQRWMCSTPVTIGPRATISRAYVVMKAEGVRHLPVVEKDRLVGIISLDDIDVIESLLGVDADIAEVSRAMRPHPYAPSPRAPLDEVVTEMAERRIGSAVVTDNGKVVGIFSAIDALRAFAGLVRGRVLA